MSPEDSSLIGRVLGHRSLFSRVFGTFFSNSSNTSGLLAVVLVSAVIYFYARSGSVPDRLLDVLYIIVGFYFGGVTAKRGSPPNDRALP